MSQVYDEPIVVRLTQPVGPYPVGSEFGFKDVAEAIRVLGSSNYFTVVRTQDGDPIPPPTPEDLTEAERQALARARAARLIRGGEFDKVVPGPGEVIVGGADGPVATPVDEIGGDPNAVLGAGVRRIIASTNPNHPLEDGDLLVLIEVPTFFTDFSEYTPGAAPHDWTAPWASATWSVQDDAGATGGKVLRAVISGVGRYAYVWNAANTGSGNEDAEIVFKWRSTATSAQVRAIVRGSGDLATSNGHGGGYNNATTLAFWTYTNGALSQVESTTAGVPAVTANTWYISRLRINRSEGLIRQRTWLAADPEPATWTLERDDSAITGAGFTGILPANTGTTEFDWVGIAYNGDTAPMEG